MSKNIKIINKFRGGHNQRDHPFFTGYFLCFFNLPPLFDDDDANEIQSWLISGAESFTPPSITITYGEVPAFGGIKKQILLSTETSSSFSISFREWIKTEEQNTKNNGMQLFKIFNKWGSIIDHNIGLYKNKNTTPRLYKGEVFILEMKPTMLGKSTNYKKGAENILTIDPDSILNLYHMYGVSPESIPLDNHTHDINNRDSQPFQVNFKLDGSVFFLDDLLEENIDVKSYVINELNNLLKNA